MIVPTLAMSVMYLLARRQITVAVALGRRSLRADAIERAGLAGCPSSSWSAL
ncbi:MAG TPA: hypothetical protein VNE67_13900 [Acetobacteraceae bacterium]|nr:hypothetical protein [Acetobacteraceae bacterium]